MSGGTFQSILMRNNAKLREDRGALIAKSTEKSYRRSIEDLQDKLETLKADRTQLLDINPGNTQTIINPSDFDHAAFVEKYTQMGLQIREIEIKIDVAQRGYNELFGELKTAE